MAKLHELLAVEGDLEGAYKKIIEEAKTTFSKRADHFFGFHRKCDMYQEGMEAPPEEFKEMDSTVHQKLDYIKDYVIRYFDAILQKEKTNQSAVADLIIDGITLGKDLPATFLLGLESRLKMVRSIYEYLPTLPPGIKWEKDETRGEHVYVTSNPQEQPKTAKTFMHKVLVEAQFPKEGEGGQSLPAQIEKWEEQKNVGMYKKITWSGMVSPAQKSIMLGKIDKLIREVKRSRQRANATKVINVNIGKEIFNFINS
jgi:hypothetical protein